MYIKTHRCSYDILADITFTPYNIQETINTNILFDKIDHLKEYLGEDYLIKYSYILSTTTRHFRYIKNFPKNKEVRLFTICIFRSTIEVI